MTREQYLRNLEEPKGKIDVVLDTDAYNEIDDQFAIAYLLRSGDQIGLKGICAAPFLNARSTGPADGMEKSYNEILRLLRLAGREEMAEWVFRGSERFLPDERIPLPSPAVDFLIECSKGYSAENPLYVAAIGAITNVASALLADPTLRERIVLVWLGGNGYHTPNTAEFNMMQDVAAARVIFSCGVPLVQLPCAGVVDRFLTTRYELEHWLKGKNPLCDYLLDSTVREAESYAAGRPWSRVIWDVTAAAWLIGGGRFLRSRLEIAPMPGYDNRYEPNPEGRPIRYVYEVHRDALFEDLFEKLTKE